MSKWLGLVLYKAGTYPDEVVEPLHCEATQPPRWGEPCYCGAKAAYQALADPAQTARSWDAAMKGITAENNDARYEEAQRLWNARMEGLARAFEAGAPPVQDCTRCKGRGFTETWYGHFDYVDPDVFVEDILLEEHALDEFPLPFRISNAFFATGGAPARPKRSNPPDLGWKYTTGELLSQAAQGWFVCPRSVVDPVSGWHQRMEHENNRRWWKRVEAILQAWPNASATTMGFHF